MPPEGVRRSSRIPKEIGILLVGSDMEGKMFSEQTKTVVLSRHGAGIVSRYALSAEQELILRRLDTNKEAEVRVVGNLGAHGKSYTYGVAFLNPETDLWDIKFPGMTDSEKEAAPMQWLQGQGDGAAKRFGIGRIPGQRRNCTHLQELRIVDVLEAAY